MPLIGKALRLITTPRYVKFSSPTTFTLGIIGTKKWDGTIEYSMDGQTWQPWDGTSSIGSALIGDNYKLFVRGYGNTIITGESAGTDNGAWHITEGSNISVSGPISSLIDYRHIPTSIGTYAYKNMFGWKSPGDTKIVDASKLIIDGPISESCCNGMFSRNKGMIEGPKFPSLNLAKLCYGSFFYQCEALNVLPRLRATTLPDGCYASFFNGCTNIKVYESSGSGHTTPYRIPFEGTGVEEGTALGSIFSSTGGDFHTSGVVNTTYYISNLIADD